MVFPHGSICGFILFSLALVLLGDFIHMQDLKHHLISKSVDHIPDLISELQICISSCDYRVGCQHLHLTKIELTIFFPQHMYHLWSHISVNGSIIH